MFLWFWLFTSSALIASATSSDPAIEEESLKANDFIQQLNKKVEDQNNRVTVAAWAYESNITDENLQKELDIELEVSKKVKEDWKVLNTFNWRTFTDYNLHRQFEKYSILGTSALSDEKFKRLNKVTNDMQKIYATAKICDYRNREKCDLALEPEITEILLRSRDADELKYYWVEWRKKMTAAKSSFKEYVDLSNEAARLNNFTDNSKMWLYDFEDAHFTDQIQKIWEQFRPLYKEMHAYVRYKLRQKYGNTVSEKGPIPAHLLGNMWAQSWHIQDLALPYPDKVKFNLTAELLKQGYTPLKMFQTAEEFFISIGLSPMTNEFWKNSIIEKPNDGRELVCHASAWDFYDGKDFRIKQCTRVDEDDFVTIHHEMGHIEYYMQYKNQPTVFREGANSGFHEAIGDLIALSVGTTKHLRKIGLIKEEQQDQETTINELFKMALNKIAFLPFGYLIDLWRWDVFSGKITSDNYNCKWWQFRNDIQGVEPPVDRSEEDFDPAAKYHIVANVPYIRYFVSYIIQFQFHRALCEKANQYDPNDPSKPLYACDIYQNKEAGTALKQMLAMGNSRPWPVAMEALTGQTEMDASGLLEYFRPLYKWLEAENKKNGVFVGWEASQKKCTPRAEEKK